jgi:cation-transporting ATPase I
MGLVALVGTQLGQTLLVGGRSPLVWVTVLATGAALVAIVQTPGVSRFFGCVPLGPIAWTTVAGSAAGATVASALVPRAFPRLAERIATVSVVDVAAWVRPGPERSVPRSDRSMLAPQP